MIRLSLWRRLCLVLTSVLPLLLVGCNIALPRPGIERDPTQPPAQVLAVSSQSRLPPSAPMADIQTLARGNAAFAFELYHQLPRTGNLLYSPYGLSLTLGMTYAGARGSTEQQMAATLHYVLPQERLHAAFNSLDQGYAGWSAPMKNLDSGMEEVNFRLLAAHGIWTQPKVNLQMDYLDVLMQNYGTPVQAADFAQDPEGTITDINDWVTERTGYRIDELVTSVRPETGLLLTSAVHFDARWLKPFSTSRTITGTFHLLDGSTVRTPVMRTTDGLRYLQGNGYQALELPYKAAPVSMLLIVPARGRFEEVQKQLTAEWIGITARGLARENVTLSLPKLHLEVSETDLGPVLANMGMSDAFGPAANFAGIDGQGAIRLDALVYKAVIDINEIGIEAADFQVAERTAIQRQSPGSEAHAVAVQVDRPFIVVVRDNTAGTILLIGRILDPNG